MFWTISFFAFTSVQCSQRSSIRRVTDAITSILIHTCQCRCTFDTFVTQFEDEKFVCWVTSARMVNWIKLCMSVLNSMSYSIVYKNKYDYFLTYIRFSWCFIIYLFMLKLKLFNQIFNIKQDAEHFKLNFFVGSSNKSACRQHSICFGRIINKSHFITIKLTSKMNRTTTFSTINWKDNFGRRTIYSWRKKWLWFTT